MHVTHLLKLLDNVRKYEMDLYCRRYRVDKILSTDGQGETSIPPFHFVEQGGIIRYTIYDTQIMFSIGLCQMM